MGQLRHVDSAPADNQGTPFESSFGAFIEWHVGKVAPAPQPAHGPSLARGREVAAVLSAWRAAERGLEGHLESGPERGRLKAQCARLRDKYHRLLEAADAAGPDAPPPGGLI